MRQALNPLARRHHSRFPALVRDGAGALGKPSLLVEHRLLRWPGCSSQLDGNQVARKRLSFRLLKGLEARIPATALGRLRLLGQDRRLN